MDDASEAIKRTVWQRDGYRCQECGLLVVRSRGMKPQTHHKSPKADGGSDDPSNLIMLCEPCHATKLHHTFMLPRTAVESSPQYIKWFLWDTATELLSYADCFDPRHPPDPARLIGYIGGWQPILERVKELAEDCRRRGIGSGDQYMPRNFPEETKQLDGIIDGLKIAWRSHHVQRSLDAIIAHGKRA